MKKNSAPSAPKKHKKTFFRLRRFYFLTQVKQRHLREKLRSCSRYIVPLTQSSETPTGVPSLLDEWATQAYKEGERCCEQESGGAIQTDGNHLPFPCQSSFEQFTWSISSRFRWFNPIIYLLVQPNRMLESGRTPH